MKNYLSLVLALAVVSSPAFATTARLQALGEGANGSYYIQDNRNMFLNPAQIVQYKKKLMIETAGKEASFINTFGDFTYSATVGHEEPSSIFSPSNAIEVGVSGEGSMNWGLAVNHGGSSANKLNTWLARFGVGQGAWNVFGNVGLYGKQLNLLGAEVKAKSNISVGATYAMDNMTVFGRFATGNVDNAGSEVKKSGYGAGLGYKKEMTKSTNLFSRVEVGSETTTIAGAESKGWNVPMTIGAETQALSWLAVRGSVAHNLFAQTTSANTTLVAAGLGMTFGDLSIDALVADGTAPTTNTAIGTGGASTGSTFGFGSSFMGNVAMTYNF
jgi:hypothetical protein